jgi:tetratricopeptide (TPR) repeat protein
LEVGKACLDAGMPTEAERHLRFAIRAHLFWLNSELMPNYLSHTLAHFYLGKLFEQTGRKAEAITAYEEFLAHFENPPTKLPQVVEARAGLKRLSEK